jgi:hypothetical protein
VGASPARRSRPTTALQALAGLRRSGELAAAREVADGAAQALASTAAALPALEGRRLAARSPRRGAGKDALTKDAPFFQWRVAPEALELTVGRAFAAGFTVELTERGEGEAPTYAIGHATSCGANDGGALLALDQTTGGWAWTPTAADVGECVLEIVASARGRKVTHEVAVTVRSPDDPVEFVFALPPRVAIAPGQSLSLQAHAERIRPGGAISYELGAQTTCSFAALAKGGAVAGVPAASDLGACRIEVLARSGLHAARTSTDVTVAVAVP